MKLYVRKHHTTGLAWNPKGGDACKDYHFLKKIIVDNAPVSAAPVKAAAATPNSAAISNLLGAGGNPTSGAFTSYFI